jgi:hypothetical protein
MPNRPMMQDNDYDAIIRAVMESANLIKEVGSSPKVYRTVAAKTLPGEETRLELMSPPQIKNCLGSGENSIYYIQGHDPSGKRVVRLDHCVVPAIMGTL